LDGDTPAVRLTPEALAAALLGLPPGDRARLAAYLLSGPGPSTP
jgi:hypothetical protein